MPEILKNVNILNPLVPIPNQGGGVKLAKHDKYCVSI